MKKRKTYRWLFVYPFQYVGFQKYLNHMANKGWKLVSIFGNNSCWLTFEKTEDSVYYVVDYTKDFSMIAPETETEKARRYRSFIEEYGYEYVGSNGALQIYRANHDNEMLRENNEEDYKALLKSSLKSLMLHLALFVLSIINVYRSYHIMKSELYCDNFTIMVMILFLILGLILLIEYMSFLYWLCRRKPIASKNIIVSTSIFFTSFIGFSFIYLLSLMTTPYLLITVIIIILYIFGIYHIIKSKRAIGKNGKHILWISIIAVTGLLCLAGSRIMIPTLNDVENGMVELDKDLSKVFEVDQENIEVYEVKSIFSQNLSISISYPNDNYVYVDRYKIQEGIFKNWIKNQYEKEEYKQTMCPGIKEGIKQNGKWIYEGDESILIVDEDTYIAVDKNFVLDDAGWEKINQLTEL